MILHALSKSPEQKASLSCCLALAGPADALLLLEDGVYAALDTEANRKLLFGENNAPQMKFYALESDLAARGLAGKILKEVQPIDYSQFVALSLEYDKVVSWG